MTQCTQHGQERGSRSIPHTRLGIARVKTGQLDTNMDANMDAHRDTNMDAHRDAHMDAHMDAHLDYNNSILNFLFHLPPYTLGGDCRGRNYPLTPLLSTFHILLLYTYSVQWCCMQMFHEKPIKVQGSTSPQTLG